MDTNQWYIEPLSPVRKIISKTMSASLANSAQLTFNTSFDSSSVISFRKAQKEAASEHGQTSASDRGLIAASFTDIIIYAVSRTILNHKALNAHFLDNNTMKIFREANIAVAVDTPRGLLVPTIFGASSMSLSQISEESKRLQGLCAQGRIDPGLLRDASFTVSSLGAMGIESFSPILNPPQTGILGVCSTVERMKNGVSYPATGLSLTFDHRALDGADAARFLQDLVSYLEDFTGTE